MCRISKGSFWKKGLSVTEAAADIGRDSLEAEGLGLGGSMSFTGRSLAVFWLIHSSSRLLAILPLFVQTHQSIHSNYIVYTVADSKGQEPQSMSIVGI